MGSARHPGVGFGLHGTLYRVLPGTHGGTAGYSRGTVHRRSRYVATSGPGRATQCRAVFGALRRTVAARSTSGRHGHSAVLTAYSHGSFVPRRVPHTAVKHSRPRTSRTTAAVRSSHGMHALRACACAGADTNPPTRAPTIPGGAPLRRIRCFCRALRWAPALCHGTDSTVPAEYPHSTP